MVFPDVLPIILSQNNAWPNGLKEEAKENEVGTEPMRKCSGWKNNIFIVEMRWFWIIKLRVILVFECYFHF